MKIITSFCLNTLQKYFRPARTKQVLEDYLDDYNMNSSKEMKLVFFQDAIDHVSRLVKPDNILLLFSDKTLRLLTNKFITLSQI